MRLNCTRQGSRESIRSSARPDAAPLHWPQHALSARQFVTHSQVVPANILAALWPKSVCNGYLSVTFGRGGVEIEDALTHLGAVVVELH